MSDLVVGVLIPSTSTWESRFGMSLVGAMSHFLTHGYNKSGGQAIFIRNKRGSILPALRQKLVEEALENTPKPTHLLLVDSDQTFPVDLIGNLLAHDKEVVACNVATKCIPASPTVRRKGKDGTPIPVYSTETSPALAEVWRVGTGVMLVKVGVFSKIPKPWFPMKWMEDKGDYQGEDWGFCELLEAAGIPIFVDHRVSLQIGHQGSYNFTHAQVKEG